MIVLSSHSVIEHYLLYAVFGHRSHISAKIAEWCQNDKKLFDLTALILLDHFHTLSQIVNVREHICET